MNGENGALTSAEMQHGFGTQEITRKLDGITNGLCDLCAEYHNAYGL